MTDILFNTFTYIFIIGIGYFLKKLCVLPKEAGDILAKIVVNLTLPAMLLSASNGLNMDGSMIVYLFLGLFCNAFMLAVSYFLTKKNTPVLRGAAAMSCAGVDVGNFVLPFVVKFFPGPGVVMLNSFNIGNTVMNNGFDFVFASKLAAGKEKFGVKEMAKKLFSSVTFDTYLLIIFLNCTGLALPGRVMQVVDVIGSANLFIVMLMIGLKLAGGKQDTTDEEAHVLKRIFFARFAGAACLTALTWLLPIPTLGKVIAALAYFGPPTTASNAYARKLGYTGTLSARMNILSIFPVIFLLTAIILAVTHFGIV